MITYLKNPIGFYGSANDEYLKSQISGVSQWRSNNKNDRLQTYASLIQESVFAESGQMVKSIIDEIIIKAGNANTLQKKANIYKELRSYAESNNAVDTAKAIANGDALHFYCNYENPNDKQYCTPFQSSDSPPTTQGETDYTMYYYIGGLVLLGGLGYFYRKELMKLF